MATEEFRECLVDVYLGEQTGEVAFEAMLAKADTPEQEYIMGSLLQFETEGKALMRPLLSRLGLSILDAPQGRIDGVGASESMNALPWLERFAAMRDIVKENYLPRYLELATLVSEHEDPQAAKLAKFMGAHETALVATAENIVHGREDPAAPVVALLHFPLTPAH
ncbi:hypothetical protein [Altererythrobacter ishigakiensis]|uniref:Rubrerythrin n=1 Tax=Altererythrobacter ishigakiensis TaxID=476157 RepID=A0A562UV42_9SPHN|nr:hypothetical protein [Altererythrobacter ishigakiensis]TWJ09457.1 hypothetical protein JN10_1092 [Altererythrobacter ishigakiensis]